MRLPARTLVLPLIVCAPGPLSAQDFAVGAHLGAGIASIDFSEGFETAESRAGFTGGAYVNYRLSPLFALGAEVLYTEKGLTDEFQVDLQTLNVDVTLRYLEIQLPLTLTIPTGGSLRPRLYAGPAFSFELSCDIAVSDEISKESLECEQRIQVPNLGLLPAFTDTKNFDIGLLAGAGLDLEVGPGAVTADVRYNLGLTDIDEFEDPRFVEIEMKNRQVQFLAGYTVYLGSDE